MRRRERSHRILSILLNVRRRKRRERKLSQTENKSGETFEAAIADALPSNKDHEH